ncbi:MAG: lactonase family protein [Chloroflexota bacterium]|nr:lactonase family protein [Chloroflexota bacterium]
MAMQPDLVYVGTYTRSGRSEGIYVYRRDPATGALARLHTIPEADPSFLAFDPRKRFLFAVSEMRAFAGEGMGLAVSFAIDQETGNLTPLSRQSTHGGEPCHLTTDPAGTHLLVANHEHGTVAVLPIEPDGRLRPASHVEQHAGSGPGPTQEGPHAHFVTFDPPGKRVLATDKGIDKVMIYTLDAGTGRLVAHDPPFAPLHSGAAPRHLAFHPNGRYAYVNGEADMTITAFAYDGERGVFEELHYLSTLPEGATGERFSTAQILVEPAGRFVYVSNRGHDSIAIYAIDQATGRLTAAGHESTRGQTPRNFAIDPSGTFLYAANQNSDTIVHFRIDRETGRLTPTGDVTAVGGPVCILFG